MKTTPIGPFLGINNRLPDFALHVDKAGDWLRSADNVDIDDAGNIHRRECPALIQAMANAHSLKMTSATTGFLVRAAALYAITLPGYSETLMKVLASDARMYYAQLGDSWYFSNGVDSGRVTASVAYPMGLPTPDAPGLTGIGGALLKGRYLVGVSHVNTTTGEEGGISISAVHELASTGGIRVTLPVAVTGATHLNIYLSGCNGSVPLLLATVAAGTATYDCIALASGRESNGRLEAPLPAGTLFEHNGRMCSFTGPAVYVGLPARPGYYLPAEGYIPFPSDVSIAVSAQSGVYIAADKTYFIPGDLGNVEGIIRDALPDGAVPGTVFSVPGKTDVGWFGVNGFVLADINGNAVEVISNAIDLVAPASGIAVVLECGGFHRVVSCGFAMNLANKAATTYSDWEFTSVSDLYGTKTDGIYLLDSTGAVTASVGFGKQNFGSEQKKALPAVYIGVSSSTVMRLRVQAPGAIDYSYDAKASSTDMKMQRFIPGKGLLASWYELTLSNTAGADFTLASASFLTSLSTRRI